tara:strand:+ start:34740 stop:35045 length:306 start_codon:yes stop_codon:yes gene_type:complete
MEELRFENSERNVRGHGPVRTRFGFRQQTKGLDTLSKRPLPAVSCLARELCAQYGFAIAAHGALPAGGTIVSVDALSFEAALVLLSIFDDARIYSDRASSF